MMKENNNMDDTVYVFMCAYNAEKTIKNSLESIRLQTYKNFKCHIVDHGSIDNTSNIINEYVANDDRFSTEYVEQSIGRITANYAKKTSYLHKKGYFITLDADDEYITDCFEQMIRFIKEEKLDVAACGNYFINVATGKVISSRSLNDDLIICDENAESLFGVYHQFMRTVWGKMYSLEVIKQCSFRFPAELCYGSDTLFAMEAFRNANRIGIVGKPLHKYFISYKSQSHLLDKNRIPSDVILFDKAIDFLILKCGQMNQQNMNFLFQVYFNALKDTFKVLQNAENPEQQKIDLLYQMTTNHYTRDLCHLFQYNEFFLEIAKYLCTFNLLETEETLHKAAEILAILGTIPISVAGMKKEEYFRLLLAIRCYWYHRDYLPSVDEYIERVLKNEPILKDMNINSIVNYQEMVTYIIGNKKEDALNRLISIIQSEEWMHEDSIAIVELGLNLAAKLEKQEVFVWFKKIKISLYLELGEKEKALEVMEDWDELLPNDEDFKDLRARINQ